jgi:hypothetical protein
MPVEPESETPSELIDAKINELDDWRGEMLSRIRGLTKQAVPDVVEEINGGRHRTLSASRFGPTRGSFSPARPTRTR